MKKKLLSIPDYQDKFIRNYKKEYEVSQNEVVKRALDFFIKNHNANNKIE